jgi:hypothetical protein
MKIDGKYVSGFEYRKKTLSKTLEIFEKLNSEEQINYIANKIVTNGIGRRTGKLIYQTILFNASYSICRECKKFI